MGGKVSVPEGRFIEVSAIGSGMVFSLNLMCSLGFLWFVHFHSTNFYFLIFKPQIIQSVILIYGVFCIDCSN